MQLVGQTCVHCQQRVTREPDGRFCPRCGSAVHNACAQQARTAAPAGCCRACGAPAAVLTQRAQAQEEQQKEATAAQGYQTVLLGVTMMIGGILASMCCTGLAGNGQFVLAGGALFGGAVLVVVGFLRSVRR